MPLKSLDPNGILEKLDLDRPELSEARDQAKGGNQAAALEALLRHYREKFPQTTTGADLDDGTRDTADGIVNHIFQWGPYQAADYGPDMDWEWDPRGDIEWVASVYRFYWAGPLSASYARTGEEKYARAFVELATDWIAKHPLENHEKTHPVYAYWSGFAWLDIQTGIRATNLCSAFRVLVHSESFTPEFLGLLLASLYDHQVKTERLPMQAVHNKAVFEQRGFVNIAWTFPEFKEARAWLHLAVKRTEDNFLAQTTSDGVQKEWSGGYHFGVLRDAVEIMQRMESGGILMSAEYRERVRRMHEYAFAMATPDLGFPMFGDASRPPKETEDRSRWPLYQFLVEATELLDDPRYAARANLVREDLPEQKSYAFPEAGMYVLRNDWGPDQTYLAVHSSPPAISSHDQPDNGTFELYACGRWLLTDSGFYTYGHDPEGRAWHRRTTVHQTLTLDGEDSTEDPTLLLWQADPGLSVLSVLNNSYSGLSHRRTIWFVDGSFFVLVDEAIGKVPGELDLHFQLAAGGARIDVRKNLAHTGFEDSNVLVWAGPKAPVTTMDEEGWFAWKYGHRAPRKAFRYRHRGPAPASFLTVIVPYRGTQVPEVAASLPEGYEAGSSAIEVSVAAMETNWRLGCDLDAGTATVNRHPE